MLEVNDVLQAIIAYAEGLNPNDAEFKGKATAVVEIGELIKGIAAKAQATSTSFADKLTAEYESSTGAAHRDQNDATQDIPTII